MTPTSRSKLTISILERLRQKGAPKSNAIPMEMTPEQDEELAPGADLDLFPEVDEKPRTVRKKKSSPAYSV